MDMMMLLTNLKMTKTFRKLNDKLGNEGMELIQVAILIFIAAVVGIIFKTQITSFVNGVFGKLTSSFK